MHITELAPFMEKLPFVTWDRYLPGDDQVGAYGWIPHGDGRFDFVVLHMWQGWSTPQYWTSSAVYSEEIARILYGDAEGHVSCQRVEWALPGLNNVVRSERGK
jgi:hypothetical protein